MHGLSRRLGPICVAGALAGLASPAGAQSCQDVGPLTDRIQRNASRFSQVIAESEADQEPGEACRLFLEVRRDLDTVLAVIREHPRRCGVRRADIDTLTRNQAGFATIARCDGR